MIRARRRIAAFLAVASPIGIHHAARAAVPDAQGRLLAGACAGCHDPDAQGDAIPPIAGLPENQIVQSMRAYRSGKRSSQIMHVVATALSEQETAAIAHYYAGQPPAKAQK